MNYLEITLARAKAKSPDKIWGDQTWIAEEKLDGWRYAMHFGGDLERTYLTGRRMSLRTGMMSEKGLCARPVWPRLRKKIGYTVVDGEVMAPCDAGFLDIASIMNVDPTEAERRISEIGPPHYCAFDLLFLDGRDVRELCQLERKTLLMELMPDLQNEQIDVVQSYDNRIDTYDTLVTRGAEGVVLKDISAPYGEGWVKVKKYTTLDVIVTGFTDAKMGRTGKYLGLIGAALVSVYGSTGNLLEVGKVSGMTDDVRHDMSENPGQWIGCVIEIAAQEFGKDRLRHPRFKRARRDADPRHATLTKMMADLQSVKNPEEKQGSFNF